MNEVFWIALVVAIGLIGPALLFQWLDERKGMHAEKEQELDWANGIIVDMTAIVEKRSQRIAGLEAELKDLKWQHERLVEHHRDEHHHNYTFMGERS